MPRDLNAAATRFQDQQTKKYEELEAELTGNFAALLDQVFPEKADGSPDYLRYQWDNAQSVNNVLKQVLNQPRRPFGQPDSTDTAPANAPGSSRRIRRPGNPGQQQTPPAAPVPPTTTQPQPRPAAPVPPTTRPAATPPPAPTTAKRFATWLAGK